MPAATIIDVAIETRTVPAGPLAPPGRPTAAAQALASVRAEGLDPSGIEPVLRAWARGELTDEQLREAQRRAAAGERYDDLLS